MIGMILGGIAAFGFGEIAGEVYHSWHSEDDKNLLINTGRKLADGLDSLDEAKAKAKKNHEFKQATKVKNINVSESQEAINNVLNSLDESIQRINDDANKEMIAKEKHVFNAMVETCDEIEKSGKLDEIKLAGLKDLKEKIQKTSAEVESGTLTIARGKTQIKTLMAKLKDYVDLANIEKISEDDAEVIPPATTFTVQPEAEQKIPDFTQPVEPLNKVADIKDAAAKKTAKSKK